MDYEKLMREMMIDLGQNFTPERFAEFTRTCSIALAETMALIKEKPVLVSSMAVLFQTMAEHAVEAWDTMHEQEKSEAVTAEHFLRYMFDPDHKND